MMLFIRGIRFGWVLDVIFVDGVMRDEEWDDAFMRCMSVYLMDSEHFVTLLYTWLPFLFLLSWSWVSLRDGV